MTTLRSLATFMLVATPAVHAQTHRVAGVVIDSAGGKIENATVHVTDAAGVRHSQQSDSAGHFVFAPMPSGRTALSVRRMGFHPFAKVLDVGGISPDSTSVTLISFATTLSAVDVVETASGAPTEFYERRQANHFGKYLDREVLDRTSGSAPSEALRGMAGVQVMPGRIGNRVRLRGCQPTIWLNGMRVRGAELDEVTVVNDIAAMEIFNSMAGLPVKYVDRDNHCGAILLWTRDQ